MRQFRLFVSSTFSDLKAEREGLRERVFPHLRDLCRAHNAIFQAVDLRWGVSQEAAEDQQTMRICLGEIDRCRNATDAPNFVALLGDRYGWRPLPEEIPGDEFEKIHNFLSIEGAEADLEFLTQWYGKDDNAVPPLYRLLPRQGEYAQYDCWQDAERQLDRILRHAVESLGFSLSRRRRYIASATEQEVAHRGLLDEREAGESVFCFLRKIDGLPRDRRAAEFLDLDEEGNPDNEAKALQENLKAQLRQSLGPNVAEYTTAWTEDGLSMDHIDALCKAVYGRLSDIIRQELSRAAEADPLESDIEAHREFAKERTRFFVGRTEALERISTYLEKPARHPLVIYGDPGSGKSTLMARALAENSSVPKDAMVFRFIGVAAGSANIRTLLQSLCSQLHQRFGDQEATVADEYEDLVPEFFQQLARATKKQPLIVFLDALDQLSGLHEAPQLSWLPTALPEDVHLVVSTLPGECLEALQPRVPDNHRYALTPMTREEGDTLLDLWLQEAGRKLQKTQRSAVLRAYATCGLPLHLRLAFEEARQWRSDTLPADLASDIPGIIRDLFARLSAPTHHGALMVSRTLSNLAASKNGLSWDEMLAVLSDDYELMAPLWEDAHFPIGEGDPLPAILWSRLYYDLAPYLTERAADGIATLDFYHGQLQEIVEQDYLKDEELTARHQMLAKFFGREKQRAAAEGTEWILSARELSEWPYQLTCGELWQELNDVLMDFEFLQAKVSATGPHPLIEDFDFVLETDRLASMKAACDDIDHLTAIRDAIRAASQVVTADPTQFASQLCGRLLASDDAAVQRLTSEVSEWAAYPWLRPLKASLLGGAMRFTLRGHKGSVRSLAVTPDGRLCATAGNSSPDQTVRIWDLERGHTLHVLADQAENSGYTPIAFTSDAEHLILGIGSELVVWSAATGLEQRRLPGHERTVSALAIAGQAPRAVSADESGALCVWNLRTWALERRLEPLAETAQLLALTPDGTRAVALAPSGVSVWDLESAEVIAKLDQDLGSLDWWDRPPLAISGDGLTVTFGHELKCWKFPDGPVDTLLRQGESYMEDDAVRSVLAMAPEAGLVLVSPLEDTIRDRYMPSGTYNILAVWDLANRESLLTLPPQGSDAIVFALSAAGHRVIVGYRDHSVRIWDVGRPEVVVASEHDNPVDFTRLMKDNTRAMTMDQSNQIRFWELETGRIIDSEDEPYIEIDQEVQAWFKQPEPEQDPQLLKKISLAKPRKQREWIYAADAPVAVEFERPINKYGEDVDPPDASPNNEIRIPVNVSELDAEGKPARLRHRASPAPSPLNAVQVTRDGKRAVSAAWGSLRVWDLNTGRQQHRLEGHTAPVWNVVLADEDRKAVSVSEDATVRVWDLDKGTLVATFTCESPLHAVAATMVCHNDSNVLTVIAGEDSGRVHILRLEGESSTVS